MKMEKALYWIQDVLFSKENSEILNENTVRNFFFLQPPQR